MPFDRGWAPHIDHEVSQLLLLHAERNSSRYGEYPEAVRRAISCAYAAHFRTLLEFFHDGRPGAKCPKPNTQDLKYSEFVNDNLRPEWSVYFHLISDGCGSSSVPAGSRLWVS